MSDLAVLLVHYRTPALLVDAVHAVLRDLEASGLDAEILVVDNGSDPEGRATWAGLPLRRIDPGGNLGYAGGVRRGVEATTAARIVAMNPDVLVVEGCLARLLAELDRGAAAAGPQFFWDRGRRLLLPPTEARSAGAEIRAALARRFPHAGFAVRAARRAWRRHARRHWEAKGPLPSTALSGALIAFRRAAWTKIGPFDEAYHLYFEETDWLLRLAAAGLEARFVPDAEAVHQFAQSSVQEPRAVRWFGEAERLFRSRHLAAPLARALALLAAAPAIPAARRSPPRTLAHTPAPPTLQLAELGLRQAPGWVEVALSASGFPAAAERLAGVESSWQLPAEVWRRLPPGELWIRGVEGRGREAAPVHLARAAPPAPLVPAAAEGG